MICINPAAFQPLEKFKREVAELARYVKDTPLAAGVKEIYYPGELEYLTEQRRRRDGIPIEDQTWESLTKTAETLGIAELAA
jgi:LDH2 family malate/lactate/ureidoglycolate dehydrogenase